MCSAAVAANGRSEVRACSEVRRRTQDDVEEGHEDEDKPQSELLGEVAGRVHEDKEPWYIVHKAAWQPVKGASHIQAGRTGERRVAGDEHVAAQSCNEKEAAALASA